MIGGKIRRNNQSIVKPRREAHQEEGREGGEGQERRMDEGGVGGTEGMREGGRRGRQEKTDG